MINSPFRVTKIEEKLVNEEHLEDYLPLAGIDSFFSPSTSSSLSSPSSPALSLCSSSSSSSSLSTLLDRKRATRADDREKVPPKKPRGKISKEKLALEAITKALRQNQQERQISNIILIELISLIKEEVHFYHKELCQIARYKNNGSLRLIILFNYYNKIKEQYSPETAIELMKGQVFSEVLKRLERVMKIDESKIMDDLNKKINETEEEEEEEEVAASALLSLSMFRPTAESQASQLTPSPSPAQ